MTNTLNTQLASGLAHTRPTSAAAPTINLPHHLLVNGPISRASRPLAAHRTPALHSVHRKSSIYGRSSTQMPLHFAVFRCIIARRSRNFVVAVSIFLQRNFSVCVCACVFVGVRCGQQHCNMPYKDCVVWCRRVCVQGFWCVYELSVFGRVVYIGTHTPHTYIHKHICRVRFQNSTNFSLRANSAYVDARSYCFSMCGVCKSRTIVPDRYSKTQRI